MKRVDVWDWVRVDRTCVVLLVPLGNGYADDASELAETDSSPGAVVGMLVLRENEGRPGAVQGFEMEVLLSAMVGVPDGTAALVAGV